MATEDKLTEDKLYELCGKLASIWDEPEFVKGIMYLMDTDEHIDELIKYIDGNSHIDSTDVFEKTFEICNIEVY